jgi:hypothetical protein
LWGKKPILWPGGGGAANHFTGARVGSTRSGCARHECVEFSGCAWLATRCGLGAIRAPTGAKGQRPTHGRAGAGLASPAGIGAGGHNGNGATIQKISFDARPHLLSSPPGEEITGARFHFVGRLSGQSRRAFSKDAAHASPSPPTGVGGECPSPAGAGEGGRRPDEGRG